MSSALLPLQDWSNFYVIVGSSAAGLTGLTFVVIALIADAQLARRGEGLRIFITPTMVHFGSVLGIAALLAIPGHTRASIAACMGVSGLLGTIYSADTTYRMYLLHRSRADYVPVLSDWLWNTALPLACYLGLAAAGGFALLRPSAALYGIGVVALVLLFIGIHNAWDIAVWVTAGHPGAQPQEHSRQEAPR